MGIKEIKKGIATLIETQIAFRGDVDEYESQNGDRITCMGGSLIYEPFTKKDVDGITDEDRAWAKERREENCYG